MALVMKTVISFGLVAIPVSLYTAVKENDISFNQLHDEDHARIKYKKVCAHCGKEVSSNDIVKGYQYDRDHYVIITDDEIEQIKTEKEKAIQILHFANLNQISPIYFDKAYHVAPAAGGEKAFELLREALMISQKIAIGKTVVGPHETLMAIIPREEGLLVQTMFFEEDMKDIPVSFSKPKVLSQELQMATMLIESMDTPFEPAAYHDEYKVKLRALIESKITGQQFVVGRSAPSNNIIDLMEALKASVEQVKPKSKRSIPKKKVT